MNRFAIVAPLVFMVIATACITATSTSATSGTLSPPNGLGLGGPDDGVLVEFMEVISDSRCPEGAVCADAGKAEVKLGITVDSAERDEVVLEVQPGSGAEHREGEYSISFLQLLPDPPPAGGVEQNDYQIELTIEKS